MQLENPLITQDSILLLTVEAMGGTSAEALAYAAHVERHGVGRADVIVSVIGTSSAP